MLEDVAQEWLDAQELEENRKKEGETVLLEECLTLNMVMKIDEKKVVKAGHHGSIYTDG